MSRCLYNSSFEEFAIADENSIFGELCENYHGDALTTTREAWKSEISIMKGVISNFIGKDGRIIFEYDIPRLGKRLDVVLLLKGIIFCIEFKVGETRILEGDMVKQDGLSKMQILKVSKNCKNICLMRIVFC